MNKFEQVSSDDHQMSLEGMPGLLSRGGARESWVSCPGGQALYSKIQCIMGNGHMGTAMHRKTDWRTDMPENIIFPQSKLGGGEYVHLSLSCIT